MSNILKDVENVGVIIARMQVPFLTESHKATINTVLERHNRVIIFLGTNDNFEFKNPYPFDFRKEMILETFKGVTNINVIPLPDQKDNNSEWVRILDMFVNAFLVKNEKAILYGGRDSFIPYYEKEKGKYKCVELAAKDSDSGTELRNLSSQQIPKYSVDAANAILWTLKRMENDKI
jgi:hypothetical protein